MSKRSLLTLLSAAALSFATAASLPASAREVGRADAAPGQQQKYTNKLYIVRMADAPVVAYDGSVKGYPATRPRQGEKIDPNNPRVANYKSYLESRQDEAVARVGGRKVYSYGYAFSGFAAELTPQQAAALRSSPGVLAVEKDVARQLDTASTPNFIGLDAPGGLWEQLGGIGRAGENVIIGIVDGGIWPESLSFADRTGTNGNASKDGKLAYQQIPGWHGRCIPGEAFNASHCNQKLIGARYYNAGWGGNAGIDAQLPWEFNSPRDYGGHGTHVASTAGGNANVPVTGDASVLGAVTGIAPRARIAAYKVCWQTPSGGSCFTTDSLAAIDQAVADGVDVINYSISGTRTNFRDAVEIAFLFAADAGVFVSASAGNSGPTVGTVAHPGPWLTTVAAGTHNRNGAGSVSLGNGMTYPGASFALALSSRPFVDSVDVGASGANETEVELCYPGTLDAAKAAGKIVLCKRGVIALVDKTAAVAEAGGAGAVIYNDPAGAANTLALFHAVPTVHVVAASGLAMKAYIASAGAGATASIAQATVLYDVPAPLTASFSSRGPLTAGNGDVLKPDVIAPGQDILAAVAPPGNSGRSFDLYNGTSMSSPHVAGLGALLKNKYPRWSPMMIKSALMTTAGDVLDGPNTNPLVIFRQGAGHVRPSLAANPGLVYDARWSDWISFICGVQPGGGCSGVTPIDPSNLNQASFAVGDLPGTQTVTRRVTNVSGDSLTVNASVTGMVGFTTTVTPSTLTLARGETKSFSVTFTRTTGTLNAYTGGQLTWTGGGYTVRSPIVVRPVALGAPAAVSSDGSATSYNVVFGFSGPFTATPRGLVAPELSPGTVTQDPDQTFNPADPTGTIAIPVTIPAGSTYARYALFDADVGAGADLDLYVYQGSTLVGSSTSGTSAEQVNFSFASPSGAPIPLTVYVHGWGVPGGSSPFVLNSFYVGTADAGNMTVSAPANAVQGETGTIELTFNGLASGSRYLGTIVYGGAAGMPAPTVVTVNTP